MNRPAFQGVLRQFFQIHCSGCSIGIKKTASGSVPCRFPQRSGAVWHPLDKFVKKPQQPQKTVNLQLNLFAENPTEDAVSYTKILAAALGIYGIILAFSLVLMICSEDGKETLEIWQSIGRSSEYLEAVKQDVVYPDDVLEGLAETDSEEGRFASAKTYACGDSEAVKEAYYEALLESGFIELQQYPEGFAVYKIEDPSEYTVDEEEEMFYLVICAENAPEGITVTATLVDENWDPVQE